MIGAFAYLLGTSSRNRLRSQLTRLRNPRYAIAAIVGILYFVLIFGGRSGRSSAAPNPLFGPVVESLAPLLVLLILSGSWLFGGDRSALAFSQAEVAMLFTAPVPRRALILYKLARSQIAILVSVLIWTILIRRGNPALPGVLAAVAFWSVFSTLSLHRLGAALVRATTVQHGPAGARRAWLPVTVAVVVFAVVMLQMGGARSAVAGETNPFTLVDKLTAFLNTGVMSVVLYPVRVVVAPVFAHTVAEWGRAMLPAAIVLVLHVWWVLRSDTAFEETAAIASSERAKAIESMRQRQTGIPAPKAAATARTLRLAASGHPAVAIFWKNMIALKRSSTYTMIVLPILFGAVIALTAPRGRADAAQIVAATAFFVTVFLVLVGGRTLRNDLRSDMLHLPLLKSLPVSGRNLVLAEIASGAIPLAALQVMLMAAAYGALEFSATPLISSAGVRLALFTMSPVVLIAVNAASFTILNGMAVLFPAWVHLGPRGPGGIEAMGQQILTTFGTLLALMLLMLMPGVVAAVAVFVGGQGSAVGIVAGCVAGSLLLGAELYAVILWLGRAFERAEPSQVAQ